MVWGLWPHEEVFLLKAFSPYGEPIASNAMFVVELSLKLSPTPISVQRKSLESAQGLYAEIRQTMESGHPQLMDLRCEKSEEKQICLRSCEIASVQLYEKSAIGAGGKRPGFSTGG